MRAFNGLISFGMGCALSILVLSSPAAAQLALTPSNLQSDLMLAMDEETAQADGEAVDDTIDQDRVGKSPVAYLSALDTIRAYFLAGQTAYQHNDRVAAGEMFVAPMTEVYVNLESVLLKQGVPTFGNAMIDASDSAYLPESQTETEAAITKVLQSLTDAEKSLPKGKLSKAEVQTTVLADLLVRAATQYKAAFNDEGSDRTWLNGYGFYKAAQYRAAVALPLLPQQQGKTHTALLSALDLLSQAYSSPTRPVVAPIKLADVVGAAQQASSLVGNSG